jgi:hypothetical protein
MHWCQPGHKNQEDQTPKPKNQSLPRLAFFRNRNLFCFLETEIYNFSFSPGFNQKTELNPLIHVSSQPNRPPPYMPSVNP